MAEEPPSIWSVCLMLHRPPVPDELFDNEIMNARLTEHWFGEDRGASRKFWEWEFKRHCALQWDLTYEVFFDTGIRLKQNIDLVQRFVDAEIESNHSYPAITILNAIESQIGEGTACIECRLEDLGGNQRMIFHQTHIFYRFWSGRVDLERFEIIQVPKNVNIYRGCGPDDMVFVP